MQARWNPFNVAMITMGIGLVITLFVSPPTDWWQWVIITAGATIAVSASLAKASSERALVEHHAPLYVTYVRPYPSHPDKGLLGFRGEEEQFRHWFNTPDAMQERIIMAAHRRDNGTVLAVSRPGRHGEVESLASLLGAKDSLRPVQGFVTSKGRFVGRLEAFKIAEDAHQLVGRKKTGGAGILFSEDLWDSEQNWGVVPFIQYGDLWRNP